MKLYLAGPMRGYPDNNTPAFAAAAAELRAAGHEVWSPHENDPVGATMREYMRRDLPALLNQDAIVLLDGWNRSHGACVERHVADVVGLPVFLFSPGRALVRLAHHDWRWRATTTTAR